MFLQFVFDGAGVKKVMFLYLANHIIPKTVSFIGCIRLAAWVTLFGQSTTPCAATCVILACITRLSSVLRAANQTQSFALTFISVRSASGWQPATYPLFYCGTRALIFVVGLCARGNKRTRTRWYDMIGHVPYCSWHLNAPHTQSNDLPR